MRNPPPTKAERRVLNAYKFFAHDGICPTLDEIAAKLECSKATIFQHVNSLVQKGVVDRVPAGGKSRYILPAACPTCGTMLAGDVELKTSQEAAVPEVGF